MAIKKINIKNTLCHSFRAIGLPKDITLDLTNTIMKWYQCNGAEWTVKRLRQYKQWYETFLADTITVPSDIWVKHNKQMLPKGSFGKLFLIKDEGKALAALSADTVFMQQEPINSERDKFLSAVSNIPKEIPKNLFPRTWRGRKPLSLPDLDLKLTLPPFEAITGDSIPCDPEQPPKRLSNPLKVKPEVRKKEVLESYVQSWLYLPTCTRDFVYKSRPELLPLAYQRLAGVDFDDINLQFDEELGITSTVADGINSGLNYFYDIPAQRTVGRIGAIPQPSLKVRWVANPNRISQWFTKPIGDHWYHILRGLNTDCTFDQNKGAQWVKEQLAQGITLAGSDLSSATDTLDRRLCLRVISEMYLGRAWDNPEHWISPIEKSYRKHVAHFLDLAESDWACKYSDTGKVSWGRGQPLGTYPSFAMLGLTNNALGRIACKQANIPLDSFRVIGDDIIMDARANQYYEKLVEHFGGSINHSKTLTSNRCAEFAGKVITASRIMSKRVKFRGLSDDNFLQIVSDLGDQAKSLLRPRQRRQYELFKFVPGVVVPGPYPQNSFGIPLGVRYNWYRNYSQLNKEREVPDKETLNGVEFALTLYYGLQELDPEHSNEKFLFVCPDAIREDFQSSLVSAIVVAVKDPRKMDDPTPLLKILERTSRREDFMTLQQSIYDEIKAHTVHLPSVQLKQYLSGKLPYQEYLTAAKTLEEKSKRIPPQPPIQHKSGPSLTR